MDAAAAPVEAALAPDEPRHAERSRHGLVEAGGCLVSSLVLTLLLFRAFLLSGVLGFGLVWYALFAVLQWLVVREREGVEDAADRTASLLIGSGAAVTLVALVAIVWPVLTEGTSLIIRGFPNFFTRDLATVGPLTPPTEGGALHAIVGTLQQALLATVAVVPLAILTAVYLNEIGGRLERPVRYIVDAMSGVPSIVAGFFIYITWVSTLSGLGHGFSGFAASLALIVLMLPLVTRTAEEVLRVVAPGLREAALALGAPEWRMIMAVVLPTARSGLVTATILGVARGVGETAPVLLTSFGSKVMSFNVFEGPQDDLPLFVFALIRSTQQAQVETAWAGAVVLVGLVLGLFTLARVIAARGVGGRAR